MSKIINKTTVSTGVAATAVSGGLFYRAMKGFDAHGLPLEINNKEVAKAAAISVAVGAAAIGLTAGAIKLGKFVRGRLQERKLAKQTVAPQDGDQAVVVEEKSA